MQLTRLVAAATLAALPVLSQDCLFIQNSPPGTDLMLGDDDTRVIALPFAFPFNGVNYSGITVSSNGFVWMNINTDSDLSDSEAELLSQGPRIAVGWDDLNPNSTALPAGGGVFYNETATQASIVWKDVPRFGSTTIFANMELVLNSTGFIYLHYESSHGMSTDQSITGISAGNGALANPLDLSALPSSPSPVILGATGYEVFAASTFDLAGTTTLLLPTSPTDYLAQSVTLPPCAPQPGPNLPNYDASTTPYGSGCPAIPTGPWYELFAGSTIDLSNTSWLLVALGSNNYAVVPGGGFDTSYTAADAITLTDDSQLNVSFAAMGSFPFMGASLTSTDIVSNGYFWMTPNASNAYAPIAADFASLNPRVAPAWMDLNPAGGGMVYWTQTANFCMGTWENVPTFGNTGTAMNTMQCKFFPNGDIEFNYMSVLNNATLANEAIVGISGGASSLTGPIDVSGSTGATFDITPSTLPNPISLSTNDPILGNSWDITTVDVPTGGLFGATLIGFSQLNIPLAGFGAPGCFQYADNVAVFFNTLSGAQTFTNSMPIPLDIQFAGLGLTTQAAAYVPGINPLNAVTSNGVLGVLGL
ncbi:MAG: hypothetical protein KDE27_26420 [Planctomycetes bacterium]|nr:hypothetical protein [Planctomycetota bacterium]